MPQDRTVDAYLASLSGWQADVVRDLRQLVRSAAPSAAESIKWAQPVYEVNGPFCYIRAFKSHVNLGFWRGAELEDPEELILTGGEKMGHVKITSPDAVKPAAFTQLVKSAVALNFTKGDPTKRANK